MTVTDVFLQVYQLLVCKIVYSLETEVQTLFAHLSFICRFIVYPLIHPFSYKLRVSCLRHVNGFSYPHTAVLHSKRSHPMRVLSILLSESHCRSKHKHALVRCSWFCQRKELRRTKRKHLWDWCTARSAEFPPIVDRWRVRRVDCDLTDCIWCAAAPVANNHGSQS